MGAAPIPSPDYSRAGANRRRPLPPAQPSEVGRAVAAAATAGAAREALDAAPAVHAHTGAEVTVETSHLVNLLAESGITNLQQLVDWLDANLRL